MRALIDIKQIDISKLNDVKIYDELPLEVEGQVAYCQGKLYYGDGSEWKEISVGGGALPEGTENQTLRHNGTEWVANSVMGITTDRVSISGGFSCNTSTLPIRIWGNDVMMVDYGNLSNVSFASGNAGLSGNNSVNIVSNRLSGNYGFIKIAVKQAGVDGAYITMQGDSSSFVNISKTRTNTIKVDDLSGTGSALLEATADGTIQRSASTLPSRIEYLSENLSGTEHTFTGTTLGITGDGRSRIKNIKCFAVDSNGDYNGALIANEFIYETDVTVNTTTNLSGSFSIKLFIEYV